MHIFFRLPIDAGQSVDLKLDAHLFSGLAPRRILRRLVSFAAAAGELPVELAIAVLHEKNPPVVVEDDARGAQHQAAKDPEIYGRGRPLVSMAPPASGGVPRRTAFFPRLR